MIQRHNIKNNFLYRQQDSAQTKSSLQNCFLEVRKSDEYTEMCNCRLRCRWGDRSHTLLGSGLFNELVLIDINQKKAEGEAMDIGHGVPFIHPVDIYAGTYEDLADAYLVIVTAGANQLPGESRINLTEKNVRIFQSIIPEIVRYNTECLLLIVANPVDILTTVALRLSGFPPERVIGSGTVLDSSRFKYRLGEYIGIDHRNVHAFIIGEHGDSEVAVWSSATVSGIAVRDCLYTGADG